MTDNRPILELRHITKTFGSGKVLDGVDLTLNKGQVLGFVGENGAGKSTLIKIISGIYGKDSGEILYNGEKTEMRDVAFSQRLGISVIYQELSLMPDLSAAQNLFINREINTTGKGLLAPLHSKKMRLEAQRILHDDLHVEIDPDMPVKDMTLAQKQIVEIARSIYADAQIIIMDEPTSALGREEREQLFAVIHRVKSKGHSVIFISHHLDEVIRVSDRIVILRDGKKVADDTTEHFTVEMIIEKMVGQSLHAQYPKASVEVGKPILSLSKLTKKGVFDDISFSLQEGEILGFVGLEGCGKNEVVRALFGCLPYESGDIVVHGKSLKLKSMKDAMRNKIAFVPAERKVEGLFLNRDLVWNMTIASLDKFTRRGILAARSEKEATASYIAQLRIKAQSPRQAISTLSGGNQQKVMLSRWMMMDPDIFLLEEPTRGIDVKAKMEVYETIGECVKKGKGVIVVSSEEEEVIGICDRIIVMRGGKIQAVLDAKSTSTSEIKAYSVNIEEGAGA
jgi:ribose transport system ATP-binding protein